MLSEDELRRSIDRMADQLPNLAIPELNRVGAQEIFLKTALGLCHFISAMDTARLLYVELLVLLVELRFSAESERGNRFPLPERHAGRSGPG